MASSLAAFATSLFSPFALPASPSTIQLAATLFLFLAAWLAIHKWNDRHSNGPPSWPIVGSALSLANNSHNLHDYVTAYCKKYRTFKVAYPGFNFFYTADPRNVEHMLKTNFSNYIKGKFTYENMQELMGEGIFNVDGMAWKQQRKIASFEFASKILRDFSESAFRDYAAKLATLLLHEAKAQRPVQMQDVMMRMTLDSFCKLSFGVEMGILMANPPPADLAFAKAFDNSSQVVFWRFVDPFWRLKRWLGVGAEAQFVKDIATIDTYIHNVLEERKELGRSGRQDNFAQVKSDLLSRFLALRVQDPEEYTDRKIRDITLNFMTAGRDTTSVTLCWFFYLLLENPIVEERVLQEILDIESDKEAGVDDIEDGVFPSEEQIRKFAQLLTYERLSKMHYLHACLAETLRLYPSVPLNSKSVVADDKLPDGTMVRKGDVLGYHAFAMGRMEWIWGEDAEKFKPERFLKDGVYQPESPFKHTAFHAGPRMCLGKDFAYLQMKVTAAVLLRFFKFELVPGQKVRYRLMLTLNQDGLKVKLVPRSIQKT